jgi:hypothetical protein
MQHTTVPECTSIPPYPILNKRRPPSFPVVYRNDSDTRASCTATDRIGIVHLRRVRDFSQLTKKYCFPRASLHRFGRDGIRRSAEDRRGAGTNVLITLGIFRAESPAAMVSLATIPPVVYCTIFSAISLPTAFSPRILIHPITIISFCNRGRVYILYQGEAARCTVPLMPRYLGFVEV